MFYTVTPFDTIFSIAQRFGVPLNELLVANNLNINSPIFPGMVLFIPIIRPVPPIGEIPPQNRIYIVRRGDNIWSIARRFGVSVQNIMFMNNLKFPIVFPGQRLTIPIAITPF